MSKSQVRHATNFRLVFCRLPTTVDPRGDILSSIIDRVALSISLGGTTEPLAK